MTLQQKFFEQLGKNYSQGIAILKAKNHDYTANSAEDPFANFRNSAEFANVEVEQGLRVRLADKLSRLKALLERDFVPAVDESLGDTLLDLMNYFNILKTWYDLGMPEPDTELTEWTTEATDAPAPELKPLAKSMALQAKTLSEKVAAIFGR